MNRFIGLLLVALITFAAVLYVKRPDLLNDIWLWVIGLIAPIIGLFKRLYAEAKKKFSKEEPKPASQKPTL